MGHGRASDHAARFFLPDEPARALELTQHNFALRPTSEALDLSAALAAYDGAACSSPHLSNR